MNDRHRTLLRAAKHIHQSYLDERVAVGVPELPSFNWEECQRLVRYLAEAHRRDWPGAERHVRRCLGRAVRQLSTALETTQRSLSEPQPTAVPSLRQLFEELCSLDDEFIDVEINLRETTVTVTTDPITLEGVYLGGFGIELDWQRLGSSKPYFIRPLDERPAASNSDVVHPHVDASLLCEGEGQVVVRRALAQGRLVDFFMVVRQILNTYNSSSAYVSLESWNSSSCEDCGGSVDDDERYHCESCESDICGSCAADCCACESSFCSQCSSKCYGCRQWHCKECLRECAVCSESFCKECQPHEECCECREDTLADESSSDTSAEVHADRVGEVAVPA